VTDAIRIRDLSWKAGRDFAIRDLSMRVPTGAIYGFLGPNGSGKTSTVRLLLGMMPADSGSIEVLGHAVPDQTPRALARLGYVPERLHLYGRLSVEESIRYHAAFFAGFDMAEAERLRRRFNLREGQKVSALSKGEAGKLMMLLALSQRPDLLVLDEPTDGLDPVVRRDVLSALVEFVDSQKATVLISSHLVHEQERICDWVGVMDAGRMVAELPMQEFRSGIKRLRVQRAPLAADALPCALLNRSASGPDTETWVVRGWQPEMKEWFSRAGSELRDVEDLDLEESFVEMLSGARAASSGLLVEGR
jgi:ABC-2 type transport system ATP-binding protein